MTPKRFSYRRVRPEFTFIGPEISLVSVEGVEVQMGKWRFDGGWGNNEYLMRHIPTQTRFLVDTGAETLRENMTARLVEVRDDYPMPDSEQIISLGRAAIAWVCEELPDSRATPRSGAKHRGTRADWQETDPLTDFELKPCPWCGGPAYIGPVPFGDDGFVVGCSHGAAAGPDQCAMCPQSLPFISAEAAAAAWNTRKV